MELRHLRYFVAVAELLNFTKAAAKLRVAQPALSRQIHDLEEELGVPLLERNSRSVRLTSAGKAFVKDAQAVLQSADGAVQTARAFATGERGEINVGYAPSLTVELLPEALRAFEKECPHVRLTLHDLSGKAMIEALREGMLDAALCVDYIPKHARSLAFVKLRQYSVCVAVPRSHPLARARHAKLSALQAERLIVFSRSEYPDYHEWLNRACDGALRDALAQGEEQSNGMSLIAAIEAGRGIAVVPSVIASVAGSRVVLSEIRPAPQPLVIGVAYRRGHLSSAAQRFVETIRTLKA
jgi:DNA-binding transcriptional LysR family regulator